MPRVKSEIEAGIEKQAGVSVLWVECPVSRKALPGDRFECRAGIEGGAVTVDIVQDEYANAKWTQRERLLERAGIEDTIQRGLAHNAGIEATVACPIAVVVAVPGSRFSCQATRSRNLPSFEIAVVIKDTGGQIDWSVPATVFEAKAAAPPRKK